MDCSGFVDWGFYNACGGEYIIGQGGGTSDQYSYSDVTAWIDAQPGDLVFYSGYEHVGIVVKNDAGILTAIHRASGYNNVVMTYHKHGNGLAFVGRPQIYDKQKHPPNVIAGIRRVFLFCSNKDLKNQIFK